MLRFLFSITVDIFIFLQSVTPDNSEKATHENQEPSEGHYEPIGEQVQQTSISEQKNQPISEQNAQPIGEQDQHTPISEENEQPIREQEQQQTPIRQLKDQPTKEQDHTQSPKEMEENQIEQFGDQQGESMMTDNAGLKLGNNASLFSLLE